jgi:hypothetical protein
MHPFGTRLTPPAPLPQPVPPFPGETTRSYVYRLAIANQLRPADLQAHLTGTRQPGPVPLDALAAAAGRPPRCLAHALPELAPESMPVASPAEPAYQIRAVCRRCAARRGAWPFASVWQPAEVSICPAHLAWVRPPARGGRGPQYEVGHLPEILRAQRRHRRLARRHGREAAATAFTAAAHVTALWARRGFYRDRRPLVHALTGRRPVTSRLEFADRTIPVVTYPETVDLASVLAMPRWHQPAGHAEDDLSHFCRDIDHRLQIHYQPTDSRYDPLYRWFRKHHEASANQPEPQSANLPHDQ